MSDDRNARTEARGRAIAGIAELFPTADEWRAVGEAAVRMIREGRLLHGAAPMHQPEEPNAAGMEGQR